MKSISVRFKVTSSIMTLTVSDPYTQLCRAIIDVHLRAVTVNGNSEDCGYVTKCTLSRYAEHLLFELWLLVPSGGIGYFIKFTVRPLYYPNRFVTVHVYMSPRVIYSAEPEQEIHIRNPDRRYTTVISCITYAMYLSMYVYIYQQYIRD